jgi:hypothetical protein
VAFSVYCAAAATAALLAPLAATAAGVPLAGIHHTSVTAAAAAPAPPGGSSVGALTLITGQRVLAGPAAGTPGPAVSVLSLSGDRQATMMLRLGGKSFVVPLTALPYLGRGLDMSLFNVSALRQAERGGRLPVSLHYRGELRTPPGITVTRARQGTAAGYLTPSSAARFGAALARQMAFDHAHGSDGSSGLFAGGPSVSLPGASPTPIRPAFPMHTLTVTGTNLSGKADNGGLAAVFNVNDPAALPEPLNDFYRGTAKYSVPEGTYWAVGVFFQPIDHGRHFNLRVDVLPQFTVHADTTVHLSARSAASKVAVTTPRPAVIRSRGFTVARSAPGAFPTSISWLVPFTRDSILVNPVARPPSDGTLRSFTFAQLTSPPGRGIRYAYTLDFPARPGTIAPQRFTVHAASLATISERYFQDRASTGGWATFGGTAYELTNTGSQTGFFPLRLPGRQIQYVSARPAMYWSSEYNEYNTISAGQAAGGQTSALRLMHAGEHHVQDWNRYPLHPGPNVVFPGTASITVVRASADRAGNTLNLDLTPFSDNQRGHTGTGLRAEFPGKSNEGRGQYALYQNGAKIASGDAAKVTGGFGDVQVAKTLSPRPSLIKFVLTTSRASKHYALSATSRDVWTWHTRPQPHATLPPPWLCGFTVDPAQRCAVQPLMTVGYQVAGLSLTGHTRPGRQVIGLDVGHIQLAKPSPITRTQLQMSFNGGKSWHAARMTRVAGGRFRATFAAPRRALVSLRVAATGAGRASLTETILRAYRTSS